jgi:hypothetical protein
VNVNPEGCSTEPEGVPAIGGSGSVSYEISDPNFITFDLVLSFDDQAPVEQVQLEFVDLLLRKIQPCDWHPAMGGGG